VFFSPETDPKIDFSKADQKALALLEAARGIAGCAFLITSHYRTPLESESVGGFKTDAHTKIPCSAFDIACTDSEQRWKIVFALRDAGFRRIGINKDKPHVHVDMEKDFPFPQDVLFIE
jgi:hypothetical protein